MSRHFAALVAFVLVVAPGPALAARSRSGGGAATVVAVGGVLLLVAVVAVALLSGRRRKWPHGIRLRAAGDGFWIHAPREIAGSTVHYQALFRTHRRDGQVVL